MDPLVSVLVPCRNERDHIEGFLDDLARQEDLPGPVEVLILDGMSDDGTREILTTRAEADSRVRLLDNPQRIVPTGLNRGIEQARGEYVVRMDVHTRYAADYIAACIQTLVETGADNVGGAARTEAEGVLPRAIAAAYASPFAVGGARFHFEDHEGEVDTVTYGCWRRQTLLDLGLFDESLVRNQDDELNLRLKRRGGRIWQSARIRSWYRPRGSLRQLFRQYFQYGFWKVAVIRKHRIPASWRHLVPSAFVASMGLGILASLVWPPARWVLLAETLAYLTFLVLGTVRIASRRGWDLAPWIPLVIACFHVSYGSGSLWGLVRGRRRGNAPAESMAALSR